MAINLTPALVALFLLSSIASAAGVDGQASWDAGAQALSEVFDSPAAVDIPLPEGTSCKIEDSDDDSLQKITFSWQGGQGIINLFTSAEVRDEPLILLFPITGDPGYKISKHFCRYQFKHGFRCAYMERLLPAECDLPEDLAKLASLPGLPPNTIIKAKHGLDALERLGIIRPGEKIGVGGISLGAIDAAVLALTDKRVGAAVLLLGAGNIPKILTEIHGAGVGSFQRLKEKVKKTNSWSDDQFQAALEPLTRAGDPLTYARNPSLRKNHLPGERFLMINVAGDTAIPNEASRELCDALSSMDSSQPTCTVLRSVSWLPKKQRHVGIIADEYLLRPYHHSRLMLGHFKKYLPNSRN